MVMEKEEEEEEEGAEVVDTPRDQSGKESVPRLCTLSTPSPLFFVSASLFSHIKPEAPSE